MYGARVDEKLKNEATLILASLGLTVSDFVRIGLTKLVHERGLPFEMKVPNAKTREAIEELESGGGYQANSVEEMMAMLNDGDVE